jgi:multidrug resistance efflux pump
MALPKLHVPKFINRKNLLIAAGVLLVVAVIAYGAVRQVQADRIQATKDAQVQQDIEKQAKANKAYVQSLEAQVTAAKQTSDKLAATCSYVKTLDAVPAITSRVTVPAVCNP